MKVKASKSFTCIILLSAVLLQNSECLFDWLFGEDGLSPSSSEEREDKNIRFEVLSSDQKFLDFAKTLTDLSPLDACYNVVVYNLKKKCGEMSEEDLGKLSVQLLNCQSEAEDRPVFKCTNSMNLADCTKDMDGTTWNSYQIVGNRARAMCYANQQTQFRRLTEVTVNSLIGAASDQLKSMEDLKNGQNQLHSLTAETVRNLYESQKDLLITQNSLKKVHEDIFGLISSNVEEIMQEKALIAAGNKELASLTENIREKLDFTSLQIQERERIEHTKHERILKDLKEIQDNTESSVDKFDTSLSNLLAKYEELESQYSDMSVFLGRMNKTMTYVMGAVEALKTQLDDRVNWITEMLGGTDMKLKTVTCCLLHLAYFFMLVMTATFLHVSLTVRLVMMVVIVANVAAELHHDYSMDFAGLTVFLLSVYLGFKLLVWMNNKFGMARFYPRVVRVRHVYPSTSQTDSLSKEEYATLIDLISRLSAAVNERPQGPRANGSAVHETSFRPVTPPSGLRLGRSREDTPDISPIEEHFPPRRSAADVIGRGSNSRAPSVSSSRAGTPLGRESRSSSIGPMSRCSANTLAGSQCRLPVIGGSDFCRRHVSIR